MNEECSGSIPEKWSCAQHDRVFSRLPKSCNVPILLRSPKLLWGKDEGRPWADRSREVEREDHAGDEPGSGH
jgi:hypothetical protein